MKTIITGPYERLEVGECAMDPQRILLSVVREVPNRSDFCVNVALDKDQAWALLNALSLALGDLGERQEVLHE